MRYLVGGGGGYLSMAKAALARLIRSSGVLSKGCFIGGTTPANPGSNACRNYSAIASVSVSGKIAGYRITSCIVQGAQSGDTTWAWMPSAL